MIEDHNRNYASMQKQANEKRKAIKDFDKRQGDKKMKEFDVSNQLRERAV